MTNVTVSTTSFQFSHGKTPRGTGHWMFEASNGEMFWFTGSFAEAKKAAIKWAKEYSFTTLTVGS